MRKKILIMVLLSLSVVVVSVIVFLGFRQQQASIRSFAEQHKTLIEFAVDNFQLGLSTGRLGAVKGTLDRLQGYSIFEGAILFDAEMTPLIVRPEGFKVPPLMIKQLQETGKAMEGDISYEIGILRGRDGEVVGEVLIAFTLVPVKAEAREALVYAFAIGLLIFVPLIGFVAWQTTRMIKPLDSVLAVIHRTTAGDVDQHIDYHSKDEIGALAQAFRELIDYIKGMASAADRLSKGDSTVKVVARSEQDVLSHSFNRMAQNLTRQRQDLEKEVASRTAELANRTTELADLNLKLETATRHKSEFLANMSHELRTPLNAVIGFSEVLKEKMFGPLNGKQEEYVEDIHSSGRHLLSLISDILDLSKIEAGRKDLELSTFDLRTALENALVLVRERANRRGIQLILQVEERISNFTADERQVKQVLLNLLSNAVKFTSEGGKITVGAGLSDGMVEISVSDSGSGIPPEDHEEIFEEFRQSRGGEAHKTEGTGLGLTLTRKFVELHGGTIWLESEVGRGSTFTFTLPIRPPMTESPVAPPAAPTQHQLVLVIEDHQSTAKLLSIQLRQEGFSIEVAHDGEEGFDKARALQPAAITLDILMPKIDGWTLLSRLKADPATAPIPVVIVSIKDEQGKGFALGAAGYLVKPVEAQELVRTVRRVIPARGSGDRKVKILIMDDDPMVLELMEAMLEPAHYSVLRAGGGVQGLRLARERSPDLIVIDLLMPDLDGFEVVDHLKHDPRTANIPIVILTGKTLTPEEKTRLNGRINHLARKGEFSRADFVRVLRSMLVQREAPWPVS